MNQPQSHNASPLFVAAENAHAEGPGPGPRSVSLWNKGRTMNGRKLIHAWLMVNDHGLSVLNEWKMRFKMNFEKLIV